MDWAVRSGAVIVVSLLSFALLFTPAVWLLDSLLYCYICMCGKMTGARMGCTVYMQCNAGWLVNDYGLYMIRVVRSIMIDHGLLKSETETESLTRSWY